MAFRGSISHICLPNPRFTPGILSIQEQTEDDSTFQGKFGTVDLLAICMEAKAPKTAAAPNAV